MNLYITVIMRGLPVWFFLLLFFFYGYGKTDLTTLNKIAGLLALLLLGTAFLIGSLSYFIPKIFSPIKSYRKYIGISGFLIAFTHFLLSVFVYYNADIYYIFLDTSNPHIAAVYAGLFALLYFLFMTLTSTKSAIEAIGPQKWKALQTAGYVALALVMLHFILAETNNGEFVIRRLLGKIVFVYGFLVLIARIVVFFLIHFHKKPEVAEEKTE